VAARRPWCLVSSTWVNIGRVALAVALPAHVALLAYTAEPGLDASAVVLAVHDLARNGSSLGGRPDAALPGWLLRLASYSNCALAAVLALTALPASLRTLPCWRRRPRRSAMAGESLSAWFVSCVAAATVADLCLQLGRGERSLLGGAGGLPRSPYIALASLVLGRWLPPTAAAHDPRAAPCCRHAARRALGALAGQCRAAQRVLSAGAAALAHALAPVAFGACALLVLALVGCELYGELGELGGALGATALAPAALHVRGSYYDAEAVGGLAWQFGAHVPALGFGSPWAGAGTLGQLALGAAAAAACFAAVLAEIHLCNVCACQEVLRRGGAGLPAAPVYAAMRYVGCEGGGTAGQEARLDPDWEVRACRGGHWAAVGADP
jgi:hypothetical protein